MLYSFIIALVSEVIPIIFGLKNSVSYSRVVNKKKDDIFSPFDMQFIFLYFCLSHIVYFSVTDANRNDYYDY